MIKISIDDEFCEWSFELNGIDDYSIKRIIEIVKKETGATCLEEKLTALHMDTVAKLLQHDEHTA